TVNYDSTATFPWRKYTGSLANNLIEYTLYDARSGALLASTNLQGLVASNSFDGLLRLTNTSISTVPYGAATLWRARYEYSLWPPSAQISYNYVRVLRNDPANASTDYHESYTYFDGLLRPIQAREQ